MIKKYRSNMRNTEYFILRVIELCDCHGVTLQDVISNIDNDTSAKILKAALSDYRNLITVETAAKSLSITYTKLRTIYEKNR